MTNHNTTKFNFETEKSDVYKETLKLVYESLDEKGYNAINQMIGFIVSGDPTYITSHNNARSKISLLERDEIVDQLLRNYLDLE